MMKYSMASYGAQFCEVRVHKETGEVRVSRWLGSFDCGRIINPKTAMSQLRGGIIMGIGMALPEETMFDERRGRIVNRSLAEYHVPVNLDVPAIKIIYTDIPDERSPLGARGVGEIGLTGAAAAIANAVFNAAGSECVICRLRSTSCFRVPLTVHQGPPRPPVAPRIWPVL